MRRLVIEQNKTSWKVSCFAANPGLIFYDKIVPT
jgi:hypothetical protein